MDRAPPLCTYFLTYSFHDMTWDDLEVSYKGPIAGTVDDSAETLKIENTTDTLNLIAAMYAVDEYSDETNKERLPVMLRAKIVDNGRRTLSGRMAEALYVSSHKIQKQYINISTGATISVHITYLNKLEPYNGDAIKHESELKNENKKLMPRNQNRLINTVISWINTVFIMIQAKSGEIQMIYLTKDRELDGDMLHSKWRMMTHGIMSRVKDTLDVYCDVLINDIMCSSTT